MKTVRQCVNQVYLDQLQGMYFRTLEIDYMTKSTDMLSKLYNLQTNLF